MIPSSVVVRGQILLLCRWYSGGTVMTQTDSLKVPGSNPSSAGSQICSADFIFSKLTLLVICSFYTNSACSLLTLALQCPALT